MIVKRIITYPYPSSLPIIIHVEKMGRMRTSAACGSPQVTMRKMKKRRMPTRCP
jgi:hypothetical protein